MRCQQHDFSELRRRCENRFGNDLDTNRAMGNTGHICLLERKCLLLSSQQGTYLSLPATSHHSLRIAWEEPQFWGKIILFVAHFKHLCLNHFTNEGARYFIIHSSLRPSNYAHLNLIIYHAGRVNNLAISIRINIWDTIEINYHTLTYLYCTIDSTN